MPYAFIVFHFVQSLKREKVLRIFKLSTGQDDHAIMFLDDYLNQVLLFFEIILYINVFHVYGMLRLSKLANMADAMLPLLWASQCI